MPHAGFGLGFERLVVYVCGLSNIRDAIPYPRAPGSAEFRGQGKSDEEQETSKTRTDAPARLSLAPRSSPLVPAPTMIFFFARFIGVAIAGLSAFLIFWPLTLVHIRDRHPALAANFGEGAFLKPHALRWLLARDFTAIDDRSLSAGHAGTHRPAGDVWRLGMALALWLFSHAKHRAGRIKTNSVLN